MSGNATAGVDHEVGRRTDTDAEEGADLVTDRAIDTAETATEAEDSNCSLNLSSKLHFNLQTVFNDFFSVCEGPRYYLSRPVFCNVFLVKTNCEIKTKTSPKVSFS